MGLPARFKKIPAPHTRPRNVMTAVHNLAITPQISNAAYKKYYPIGSQEGPSGNSAGIGVLAGATTRRQDAREWVRLGNHAESRAP